MQLSHMIQGVNKMGEKVSVADVNRARGSGGVLKTQQGVRGPSPLRRFLGSK